MGRSSMGPSFSRSFWEKIILLPTIEEYFSQNAVMDSWFLTDEDFTSKGMILKEDERRKSIS